MQLPRTPVVLVLAVLAGFAHLSIRAPQTVDLASARDRILKKQAPNVGDFFAFADFAIGESARRKLPSFMDDPESSCTQELVAFRKEVYGPLLANEDVRKVLRQLARSKPALYDLIEYTAAFALTDPPNEIAAQVLADAPDEADVAALLDGYQAAPIEERAVKARPLGRAIFALRGSEPPVALARQALDQLRADATTGKPVGRGAALEGLFRAGEIEMVVAQLRFVVDGQDALETMSVLQSSARLFLRKEIDPSLQKSALALTHAEMERLLAEAAGDVTPMEMISGKGRMLRAAVAFLQDAGGEPELELLLRCVASRRAQGLLGSDGLQTLRNALSMLRPRLRPDGAAHIDATWLALIVESGTRLSTLEEEPFDADEQRRFLDRRDLRFNALGYFCDRYPRTPEVAELLRRTPDAAGLLATLARARREVVDGDEGARRWHAVAEKAENRVLALELLARLEHDGFAGPSDLDVFGEALAMVCSESKAEVPGAAAVKTMRESSTAGHALEIKVGKAPDDAFIRWSAAQAIAYLGYVVDVNADRIRIFLDDRHPDANHRK